MKISVLGEVYTIVFTDKSKIRAGGIDFENKIITVRSDLTKYDRHQTVLHELFHAVLNRSGATQNLTVQAEEVVVDSIATFISDHWDLGL